MPKIDVTAVQRREGAAAYRLPTTNRFQSHPVPTSACGLRRRPA